MRLSSTVFAVALLLFGLISDASAQQPRPFRGPAQNGSYGLESLTYGVWIRDTPAESGLVPTFSLREPNSFVMIMFEPRDTRAVNTYLGTYTYVNDYLTVYADGQRAFSGRVDFVSQDSIRITDGSGSYTSWHRIR